VEWLSGKGGKAVSGKGTEDPVKGKGRTTKDFSSRDGTIRRSQTLKKGAGERP